MVALALWLLAGGVALVAVLLAVVAVGAVFYGVVLGMVALWDALVPPRRVAATAAARRLGRRPYTAPSAPRH